MKRSIPILLALLFLVIHVNAVSAVPIEYSFIRSVQATNPGEDPLNIDGGSVELTFKLDSDATGDDESHIVTEVVESIYYNVSSCLTMTQDDGTVIYSGSVFEEAYVNDSYQQTNIVDSVGWYAEDITINSGTYRISMFAGLPWDFISTYPLYPKPFAFNNSDVIWHGMTIYTTENGEHKDWVYRDISSGDNWSSGTSVPEPAAILLLGTGLIGLAAAGRKKFAKK